MPIYAYRCAACGHALDKLQKLSDEPLLVCPACGAPELRKQLTAAGFQLKGSGWYATDFRNSGAAPVPTPKPDATAEAKGEGKADIKDAGKADSKSESKSDVAAGESAAKPAAAPTPPAASAPESK
jgi:putative FmdB family regulatory protein